MSLSYTVQFGDASKSIYAAVVYVRKFSAGWLFRKHQLHHAQENAFIRLSVRCGPHLYAMEVENFSTSIACPRAPRRKESLMLSQVRSDCVGETSVVEDRLYACTISLVQIVQNRQGSFQSYLAGA
mgnify:CR=1 FL=1